MLCEVFDEQVFMQFFEKGNPDFSLKQLIAVALLKMLPGYPPKFPYPGFYWYYINKLSYSCKSFSKFALSIYKLCKKHIIV